jgi:pimeloyl-ACP methyl ester carboxylesterase/uncharacterized protein YndB with AHSA1/START domain
MDSKPTLLMIPCFAGAPWQLDQLRQLQGWPMRTMRLPERLDDLEQLADFVLDQARDLGRYVLVGDSFGAVIAIAVAVRQPPGLVGLVISGGFARNPITSPLLRGLAALAPYFPGPFYRQLTLRVHAANLQSRFDAEGEVAWSTAQTRSVFVRETPHRAYVNRVHAVGRADFISRLAMISVPTLILTPEDDRLIGRQAAGILLGAIRGSTEVVLPRTGHMFRFSHPGLYSRAVRMFLELSVPVPLQHAGTGGSAMTRRPNAAPGIATAAAASPAGMAPTVLAAVSSAAQIEIAAPPERVWELLSDIDRWPSWNPLVQRALINRPFRAGSVFRWKSGGFAVTSTLREVTGKHRIAWTGKAFGTHAVHTWEIAATNRGSILKTAESFGGWLPKLMPGAMKRTLEETLPAWLKAIKAEAERNP